MRQSFKVSFYLRSNYENKEGKSPVMLRIFLGGAMSNLGSTKIFVDKAQWNNRTSRQKGRSSEALAVNASLDAISANLHSLYHKYQDDQTISLDKLRSAYLGQIQEFSTFLPVFDKFIDDIRQRVGHTISKESLQKYSVLRKHFFEFLVHRYKRKDIGLMEFTPAIIQDFELYLTTVASCAYNTAVKKMKTLKTVTIYALKRGYLLQDPFRDHHFHLTPVDRGFLTDEEILKIANKELTIPRLALVRDLFLFSSFTGLAYIDVANLRREHLVTMNGKTWIMTRRKKTRVESNILLLDIPKAIIEKYSPSTTPKDGKLFPHPLQPEDECLPQGDRRRVWRTKAAHLPSGPPHLCDDVAQQRCTDGERLKDAGAYQHQDHADLCPYHQQEDRARYGAASGQAR